MSAKYLYLMMNVGTILFPFLFSFEKRVSFYKHWKYLFPAIIITAVPFIIFDHFYTTIGVWGFNEKYITGIRIFNLPVEEIMFFFTIPYACLFIYVGLNKIFPESTFWDKNKSTIAAAMILLCVMLAIVFFNRSYTSVICIVVIIFLGFHIFYRSNYMGKYWRFFSLQLIPFVIVNGILTGAALGKSVFWYDKDSITNFRIGTIPVEDVFFALALLLMNVTLYEWFKRRGISKQNLT